MILRPIASQIPVLAMALITASASADEPQAPRLITVSGSATVQAVPDRVVVTVGVSTVDKDIHKALATTDERVRKLFEIAEQHDIEERHVRTNHVGISPSYEYRNNERVWVGHEAAQTVALTLSDISRYESLMTALLVAGVNRVDSVSFQTTELRVHKDRARTLAVSAAREKAIAMSAVLGEEVGRVHAIVEEQDRNRVGRLYFDLTGNDSERAESEPLPGESTIALGEIGVRAEVTVSFELK